MMKVHDHESAKVGDQHQQPHVGAVMRKMAEHNVQPSPVSEPTVPFLESPSSRNGTACQLEVAFASEGPPSVAVTSVAEDEVAPERRVETVDPTPAALSTSLLEPSAGPRPGVALVAEGAAVGVLGNIPKDSTDRIVARAQLVGPRPAPLLPTPPCNTSLEFHPKNP